jgi:hypothetical protein
MRFENIKKLFSCKAVFSDEPLSHTTAGRYSGLRPQLKSCLHGNPEPTQTDQSGGAGGGMGPRRRRGEKERSPSRAVDPRRCRCRHCKEEPSPVILSIQPGQIGSAASQRAEGQCCCCGGAPSVRERYKRRGLPRHWTRLQRWIPALPRSRDVACWASVSSSFPRRCRAIKSAYYLSMQRDMQGIRSPQALWRKRRWSSSQTFPCSWGNEEAVRGTVTAKASAARTRPIRWTNSVQEKQASSTGLLAKSKSPSDVLELHPKPPFAG